ncbi:zinc-binding dehydrogenase [Pseudomonas aeruginosa]|uniref:zinc-binding dehydrogenase n=1 Tax=Pseudomonas aeruginosa TaxID=287 RepID=UPI0005AAA4AD|nr:zinc-binding dehydrogenase [Pseudomonas aeruginosa]MBG5300461.1 zinc-binding dehydrogenase [Pseudomonas aeruginosa]MDI3648291.1 zinc-binding dehydrogenase [Pseudomonas aeruginosa]MDI3793270.1 zinc-binding dehydrogenase [Pseudomonas aeruginosa]QMX79137.1 zinc-binding dehydrogenase [Pseudomonas aeruginosa]RPP83317.1 alcohol dehydrogenase [Pseudomonas aeruginosa]
MSNDYLAWGWTPGAGLDGLHLLRKPLPTPGPGEVLVANRAIALNPVDWKIVEWGHAAWSQDHVPGVDGVGRVVATGAGCDLTLGSRVAYHQWLGRDGSFAEYTLLDADALLVLPGGLDEARAAALPCPALTAWQALEKVPGGGSRDVLVVGAGGAVGLFLAQLAVRRGWRVWATAATEHREPLLGLGVLGVFDYRRADWRDALAQCLGERSLFAVFDTVSGEHAAGLASLLGYNGHLVCIQDRLESAPLPAFGTAISQHEVALNSIHSHAGGADRADLRRAASRLLHDLRDGDLRLPPLLSFDFQALPQALRALRDGSRKGKWIARL